MNSLLELMLSINLYLHSSIMLPYKIIREVRLINTYCAVECRMSNRAVKDNGKDAFRTSHFAHPFLNFILRLSNKEDLFEN